MVPTTFIMIEVEEGNELFLKKKFQESIKKYEIVLEHEPNNLIALNNKGYSLSKLKNILKHYLVMINFYKIAQTTKPY